MTWSAESLRQLAEKGCEGEALRAHKMMHAGSTRGDWIAQKSHGIWQSA